MPLTAFLGAAEREYITAGVEDGVRNDGRGREDYRTIELKYGVLAQANGSAKLTLGGTDVIVGVKVEIGAPDEERPDCGRVCVAVECSPVASPAFQGRGGDELGAELTAALERGLYPGPSGRGAGLDLAALSIVAGKSCWVVHVDALLLNMDGNVLDALSIAAKAALGDTKIPRVDVVAGEEAGDEPDFEVDDDPEAATRLDVSALPIVVTVSQVGTAACVDLNGEEEQCASAAVQVAVDPTGCVTGITKRQQQGLEPGMLMEMLSIAQRLGPEVHTAIGRVLAEAMAQG